MKAIKEVQATRRYGSSPVRLWIVSGQVVDIAAESRKIEGDIIPIHPEFYHNYDFIHQEAMDLDWSLSYPGKVDQRGVRVLLYTCR